MTTNNSFLIFAICISGLSIQAAAEIVYHIDFEDGTTDASVGTSKTELSAQGSDGGLITAEQNPLKTSINMSNTAGRCRVPTGYRRAELSSARVPTENKTYLYNWSYYLPPDFYENAAISWTLISQFKTWPCGDHDGFENQICYNCGIFNDISAGNETNTVFDFRWRAEPDCHAYEMQSVTGEWIDFQMEVFWTNSNTGYAVLWMNGTQITEIRNIKTLFDGFTVDCNMYWAVGIYCSWEGTKEFLDVYVDNIQIRDTSGVTEAIAPAAPEKSHPAFKDIHAYPGQDEFKAGQEMQVFNMHGAKLRAPESGIILCRIRKGSQAFQVMRLMSAK